MTRRICASTSQAFAFALLLLVGHVRASRASDKHDAMKAISHHSLLKTNKTDSSAKASVASLAIDTKAAKADSSAKGSAASTAIGTKADKTVFSAKAFVTSIAVGTKATLRKTADKARRDPLLGDQEGHSEEAEPVTDDAAEQTPKALCSVPDDLQPDVALREIERCVKQLEMIKEGTLEQGKTSWEHNNKYVKSLAGLENRMTELSRPEPFEIAFAVDQADMYEKLKNRLQAIQLDLPKLQGLPGAIALPGLMNLKKKAAENLGNDEADAAEEQDMPEAEDGSKEQDASEEQDMAQEQDMPEAEEQNSPTKHDMAEEQDMPGAEEPLQ